MILSRFADRFLWGVPSSAYQIEGAVNEDDKVESIRGRFTGWQAHLLNGDDGAAACNHQHRYGEDVAFVRALRIPGTAFGAAWTRLVPPGADR